MIQVFKEPKKKDWPSLLARPEYDATPLQARVREILLAVKQRGDAAVTEYTLAFDKVALNNFKLSAEKMEAAEKVLTPSLKTAIQLAKVNIEVFHSAQIQKEERIETMPGVWCWRKSVGIEKVGIYIPGGSAPLFSTVLMLGIPAKLAGCKEIILCTPPNAKGEIDPAIIYAASLVGVSSIFTIGGVQAIAALAYGTKSVPKVYKIFGPGNQYVTAAKQIIQQEGVAIDMPAGPSEVCVYADETSIASFVAADLLSQAEHGADSQVLFIASTIELVKEVQKEIEMQLTLLPRKDLATKALENSKAIILSNIEEAISMINEYAPEHLILSINNAAQVAEKIINAGSIFIGNFSPESVGDYASGTNHTLPTNGFAKAYSGVSMDSFVKKITFQQLTERGLENIAPTVIEMSTAEGLQAHSKAVELRVEWIKSKI
ncbi:MAG: histidinol dehydrogenase [Sediminibacterium sp.]|jgi:histidinol dehydrogenase|nr:MAG: histidinol dehydrogenase [Sediminibacterium sp.]